MKIRYQPRRNSQEVELRDIKGGSEFAKWSAGQEREVPALLPFQNSDQPVEQIDGATAIFRHGPDFVDAATGKNPLFSCVDCGAEALTEHWWEIKDCSPIPFENSAGQRQCVPCWLSYHPERFAEFIGRDRSMRGPVEQAQALIAKRQERPATARAAVATQLEAN